MTKQQKPQYPAITFVLAHRRTVLNLGFLAVLCIVEWFAYRMSSVDLAVVGLLIAAGVYLVLQVAVELVALVADTLMPR